MKLRRRLHDQYRQLTGLYWRTRHRTANRWYDLRAQLAGYCNHKPWSPIPGVGGGYSHWRCAKRANHIGLHRVNNYVWDNRGKTSYDPLRINHMRQFSPRFKWHGTPTIRDSRYHNQWQKARQRERLAEARLERANRVAQAYQQGRVHISPEELVDQTPWGPRQVRDGDGLRILAGQPTENDQLAAGEVTDRHRRWADLAGYGTNAPDPTHGQIDPDIRTAANHMQPRDLGQRTAIENTLQNDRDLRHPRVEINAEPDTDDGNVPYELHTRHERTDDQ